MLIHHKVRIRYDYLVARIDKGHKGQQQPSADAAYHENRRIIPPVLFAHTLGESSIEHGVAGRLRIAVLPGLDRPNRFFLQLLGHIEVGLAYRKINGILQ